MPRFFDDYSNTYLTHDSAAGRKQQRRGWKFRENFKLHYEKNLDEWRSGPMGLASAQQAYLKSRPPDDPSIPPLPEGWKEEFDDATHISYYVHKSGRRTWVRPGFRPPPSGGGGGGPPGFQGRPPMRQGPPPSMRPPMMGQGGGPPPIMGQGGAPPPMMGHGGAPPPPNYGLPPPNFQLPPPGGASGVYPNIPPQQFQQQLPPPVQFRGPPPPFAGQLPPPPS
ncbi:U1 zinc finger [Fragilaria crotonensis]|nr:U1 zinc finger [Fragilaria crotonensis]